MPSICVTASTTAAELLALGVGVESPERALPVLEAAARAIAGASGRCTWWGGSNADGSEPWAKIIVGDRTGIAERRYDGQILSIEATGMRTGDAFAKMRNDARGWLYEVLAWSDPEAGPLTSTPCGKGPVPIERALEMARYRSGLFGDDEVERIGPHSLRFTGPLGTVTVCRVTP